MNILKKLQEARKIIRETKEKKGGTNSFSKYDYFTPEQVEALVYTACEKTKTICLTNLRQDNMGYFQTLTFLDIEKPVSEITFELRTAMPSITATNDTQKMGGMDTYSERYIKMKVFQIKDNNLDFDAQDNRVQAPKPIVKTRTPAQVNRLVNKQERRDDAEHDVTEFLNENDQWTLTKRLLREGLRKT